jgi:hypothetical protein
MEAVFGLVLLVLVLTAVISGVLCIINVRRQYTSRICVYSVLLALGMLAALMIF